MHPSEPLNRALQEHHPAAHACLTPLGRRMFFPMGIPAQAAEAKTAQVNATIGQLTDGLGAAMPLPAIAKGIQGVSANDGTLYAPQGGRPDLRMAWRARLEAVGGGPMSRPFCTVGLTHGLSLLGDLFVDADTDVLLPDPGWGNYGHIFDIKNAGRIVRYPVFEDGRFCEDAIAKALATVRTTAVVVLNFPGNPTGYTPTPDELEPWLDALRTSPKPIVVICDDAYAGFVYEDGCAQRSPFHALNDVDPSRALIAKVDGATKELSFFGGRVGFVTFSADGPAADALEHKIKGLARANVSTAPSVAQAVVLDALNDPDLARQQRELLAHCRERYAVLRRCIDASPLECSPFNSGFFTLIRVPGDPHALRKRLLDRGFGIVALPQHGAIRIAFSSTRSDDIPALIDAIAEEVDA
ncbi:MAG: aminotransferase class I/II-fold pyridoxal phosphate-dependent enzyme [Myxococcota bacterium]|nr:aminotransferase class I/II-fold pyridoxal phosphate-dependent enzyme [Myxococcota bacterium]